MEKFSKMFVNEQCFPGPIVPVICVLIAEIFMVTIFHTLLIFSAIWVVWTSVVLELVLDVQRVALSICLHLADWDAVVVDTLDASPARGDRRGQCEHNNKREA